MTDKGVVTVKKIVRAEIVYEAVGYGESVGEESWLWTAGERRARGVVGVSIDGSVDHRDALGEGHDAGYHAEVFPTVNSGIRRKGFDKGAAYDFVPKSEVNGVEGHVVEGVDRRAWMNYGGG